MKTPQTSTFSHTFFISSFSRVVVHCSNSDYKMHYWSVLILTPIVLAYVAQGSIIVPSFRGNNASESEGEDKIVGGRRAGSGQFPWHVEVTTLAQNLVCGGSLISSNAVLTASHCTTELGGYKICAGTLTLNDPNCNWVRVSRIIRHPQWNSATLQNDLAILVLERTVSVGSPVNLPNFEPPAGTSVTLSGWGLTSDGGILSRDLLYVQLNILDRNSCRRQMGDEVTDNMICTAGGFKGSCQGDSGGALVQGNTQVGIVSWGHRCGDSDVYTNVAKYTNWIKSNS